MSQINTNRRPAGKTVRNSSFISKIARTVGRIAVRVLIVLGITVAALLIFCVSAIYLFEKASPENVRVEFVSTVHETSALKWIPYMFLSESEVQEILDSSKMADNMEDGQTSDTDKIEVDIDTTVDPVEINAISGSTYKGNVMIIHDPSRVFLGTVPEFGKFAGMKVADIIDYYNNTLGIGVVGGVNAGDFVDMGSYSYTAQPLGAIFSQGELLYAQNGEDEDTYYHLTGLTDDNKLVVGYMSIPQAKELGIRDAVYNAHETGPFLIVDGVIQTNNVPNSATYGGGKNPRTAIGQRSDGAIILLVIDGRRPNSLGATFIDLAEIMEEYGCINACAMDGGTSTQMIYEGSLIDQPSAAIPRQCPTAWLVKFE